MNRVASKNEENDSWSGDGVGEFYVDGTKWVGCRQMKRRVAGVCVEFGVD